MGCLIVLGWKHWEIFPGQWFHAEAQQYDDWWPHKTHKDKDILNITDYYFLNCSAELPTQEQNPPSTPAVPNYVFLARWKPWPEHRWITITESQKGLGWNRPERLFGSNNWPNQTKVLALQQHPQWSCKQLQKQWGNEGGIPFWYIPAFYKPLMLWHFMLNISAGRESILMEQGRLRVEQWQQFLLMCSRKTFFPNPNLILIYILKHEDISHPIFLLSEGWVLFRVDFCLKSLLLQQFMYI